MMYEKFYGIHRNPFSLLPDPSFLFLSRQHLMALTLLKYSLMSKHAFAVVTGEVGAGKTTLINQLLDEIHERSYTVGMINFTDERIVQLWPWILRAYGMPYANKSSVRMYDDFLEFLHEEHRQGRTTILVVDEAQNLAQKALENLRMLSNVNGKQVLLQLVLVGQPEFRETLKRADFRQLNQRVSVFYRLDPLNQTETRDYIVHRLRVAGRTQPLFDGESIGLIWKESGGIARRINTLCDLALVYGFASRTETIDGAVVHEMLADRRDLAVQTEPSRPRRAHGQAPASLQVVQQNPIR
jgi:general secretion pathway protein A